MKLPRRTFLQFAGAAVTAPTLPLPALGLDYPTRPVRIVVAVAPGGTFDIVARLMAQWLTQRFSQQFVIENRPGAGTNIGTEAVAHAPSDGYTLLVSGAPAAINATLYENLNFKFIRDFAPVAGIYSMPLIMTVNPVLPVKTVPQFISYAKANPGKINMGSGGIGSTSHVAGALFGKMAGIAMAHVPYRSEAPAVTDLLGSQVDVVFATAGSVIQYVKAGSLRALGISATTRLEALSEVPSLMSFVPGYEARSWGGLAAPRGTPVEIVGMLNREVNAALDDPKIKTQFVELEAAALMGSPADFGRFIAQETEKWGKVVNAIGAKMQ